MIFVDLKKKKEVTLLLKAQKPVQRYPLSF